jgi:hypothetical protein
MLLVENKLGVIACCATQKRFEMIVEIHQRDGSTIYGVFFAGEIRITCDTESRAAEILRDLCEETA